MMGGGTLRTSPLSSTGINMIYSPENVKLMKWKLKKYMVVSNLKITLRRESCLLEWKFWAELSCRGKKAHVSWALEVLCSQTGIPKSEKNNLKFHGGLRHLPGFLVSSVPPSAFHWEDVSQCRSLSWISFQQLSHPVSGLCQQDAGVHVWRHLYVTQAENESGCTFSHCLVCIVARKRARSFLKGIWELPNVGLVK